MEEYDFSNKYFIYAYKIDRATATRNNMERVGSFNEFKINIRSTYLDELSY